MPEDYHNLFETSPLGICIIQDGLIQHANRAIIELLGYTMAELTQLHPNQLLYSTNLITVLKKELQRLNGQTVPSRYEFTVIKRDQSLAKLLGFFSLSSWNDQPAILVQVSDLKAKN